LIRPAPGAEPEAVLVLRTLGAPERRRLKGRRGRKVEQAEPEPVPTSRATVVRPQPFASAQEASSWLSGLKAEREQAERELEAGVATVNRALRAQRAAAADPYVVEVSAARALVSRIGYGIGDEVVDGRYAEAWELPREAIRTRRSMEAPEERFAAILGGHEEVLPAEELVLRARADLDAGRPREAALEARVALESLLADLPGGVAAEKALGELDEARGAVGDAANAALRGDLPDELARSLADAVGRMEAALRRRRLGG
jgi:hypothetical protein